MRGNDHTPLQVHCPEQTRDSQNSKPSDERGQRTGREFLQRRPANGQQTRGKMLPVTNHWGCPPDPWNGGGGAPHARARLSRDVTPCVGHRRGDLRTLPGADGAAVPREPHADVLGSTSVTAGTQTAPAPTRADGQRGHLLSTDRPGHWRGHRAVKPDAKATRRDSPFAQCADREPRERQTGGHQGRGGGQEWLSRARSRAGSGGTPLRERSGCPRTARFKEHGRHVREPGGSPRPGGGRPGRPALGTQL